MVQQRSDERELDHAFQEAAAFIRDFVELGKVGRLIIMIRPKHFGAVLQAVTTKEPDKPDAITSVGHPMTCLMKVTMSCTYKKFVYVIAGLSERPQPRRSSV